MNLRIQNIVLPWDTGPEVEFNIFPFIMFNSLPDLGHGNNFECCKRYIAPRARTKKEKEKRSILDFGPNLRKREKIWKMPGVGYYHLRDCTPKYLQLGYLREPAPHSKSVVLAVLYLFVRL